MGTDETLTVLLRKKGSVEKKTDNLAEVAHAPGSCQGHLSQETVAKKKGDPFADRLRDGCASEFYTGSGVFADVFVKGACLWAGRAPHLSLEHLDALLVRLERAGFVAAFCLESHQCAINVFAVRVAL
jgi:hypothetical protein